MNETELLQLRAYAEGAYPILKQDEISDVVWADLLLEYEYFTTMQALKGYIKAGNKFPPTVADLIRETEKVLDDEISSIISNMTLDGVLDDGYENDMQAWNIANRKSKIRVWVKRGVMPEWFRTIYEAYKNKERHLALPNETKRIKGVT